MFRDFLPEITTDMVYDAFLTDSASPVLMQSSIQQAQAQSGLGCAAAQSNTTPAAQQSNIGQASANGSFSPDAGDVATQYGATPDALLSNAASATQQNNTAAVFDPCSSRDDPDLQHNIRKLAVQAGYALEELPLSREEAACCSWGGQSFTADPALAQSIVESRISGNGNHFITYCTNCRDIFSAAGKPCRHILDILLGINEWVRESPTATQRRRNRIRLKRELIKQYGDENMAVPEESPPFTLIIDAGLARQMSDALILEEDIHAVIAHCEQTGQKLQGPGAGQFTGHLKRGIITYWAVYSPTGEGCFTLDNAYSHRLNIEEDD
jgi:hypothetical protein